MRMKRRKPKQSLPPGERLFTVELYLYDVRLGEQVKLNCGCTAMKMVHHLEESFLKILSIPRRSPCVHALTKVYMLPNSGTVRL